MKSKSLFKKKSLLKSKSLFKRKPLLTSLIIGMASSLPSLALAERVVSIGGTVTEIVYLLGEQDQLVATDTSSVYPEAANQTPKVGYQRTLSAEGVLSVKPDLLLLSSASGPQAVIRQLEDAGIKSQSIDAPLTQQGIYDKVQQVANALNAPAKGEQAVGKLKQAFAELHTPKNWTRPPRLLFIMQMGGAPMIAGQDTAPDGLFKLAGAINAAGEVQGYKNLTPEALISAKPDAIVVTHSAHQNSSQTGQGGQKVQGGHSSQADTIWNIPGIAATPASQQQQLVTLDTLLALGFGPRTPEAISQLYQQLAGWQP